MSRWHLPSCSTPDIVVNDSTFIPHCRACDTSPNINDIIEQQKGESSTWVPPSDELEDLNLWWPPSVPYIVNRPDGPDMPTCQSSQNTKNQDRRSIYDTALQAGEFRLLCLHAAPNEDSRYPLHGTLEVYPHAFCPEYEAASYTWASEDMDTRRTEALYLGPFWDLLMQNMNCGSMLKYFRPLRGSRMVWIDAICIDQQNDTERSSQVSMMGAIYQASHRVVVYLGRDVVGAAATAHRARRSLHLLDRDHFVELLQRRYFKRVWVIQELLLASYILIPVGDTDYQVHQATPELIGLTYPKWNWDRTEASWVQHMMKGSGQLTLSEALTQTRNAESTDPRDRIFGLLGLIQSSAQVKAQALKPEYSLSLRQMEIGISAYLLLILGNPLVLFHASRMTAPRKYPSWVSSFCGSLRWMEMDEVGCQGLNRLLWSVDRDRKAGKWRSETFMDLWAVHILAGYSESQSYDRKYTAASFSDLARPFEYLETYVQAWKRCSAVIAYNGRLSVRLIKLMALDESHIVQNLQYGDGTHFTVSITSENSTLILSTGKVSIEESIGQGRGEIFLYVNGTSPTVWLLLLEAFNSPGSYRLLSCCPCYGIHIETRPNAALLGSSRPDGPPDNHGPTRAHWWNLGGLKSELFSIWRISEDSAGRFSMEVLDSAPEPVKVSEPQLRLFPYLDVSIMEMYDFFDAILPEPDFRCTKLIETLAKFVKKYYDATDIVVKTGRKHTSFHFSCRSLEQMDSTSWVKISRLSWKRIQRSTIPAQMSYMSSYGSGKPNTWTFDRPYSVDSSLGDIGLGSSLWAARKDVGGAIQFKCHLFEVHSYLDRHRLRQLMLPFKLFCPGGSEEVFRLMARPIQAEDWTNYALDCPDTARKDFAIDGTMHNVTIA